MERKVVNGFYKLDNTVLTFDTKKDVHKILLNHLIMRKENLSRRNASLGKAQFNLSITEVMNELGVNKAKATRLIKEFVELNIITCVHKGTSKNNISIYQYNEVANEVVAEGDAVADTPIQKPVKLAKGWSCDEVNDDMTDYDYSGIYDLVDYLGGTKIKVNVGNRTQMDLLKTVNQEVFIDAIEVAKLKGKNTIEFVYGVYQNKMKDISARQERYAKQQEEKQEKKQNKVKDHKSKKQNKKNENKEFTPNYFEDAERMVEEEQMKRSQNQETSEELAKVDNPMGKYSYEKLIETGTIIEGFVKKAYDYATLNGLDTSVLKPFVSEYNKNYKQNLVI